MVDSVSVLLHWNTDYAEIPRVELPKVVEKSYEPIVNAIENWKGGTICFNITGHTLEYLIEKYPSLVNKIKSLVKDNLVEILASGYSHPIFPLLPRKRIETQVIDHISQIEEVFSKKPKGLWPPELAISPAVLRQFKELGIEWVTIDYEHFKLAQWYGNDCNPFEKRNETILELLSKASWKKGLKRLYEYIKARNLLEKNCREHVNPLQRVYISGNESIKVYLSSVCWSQTTQFGVGESSFIYNSKKHLKRLLLLKSKSIPLYTGDVEFFGYRDFVGMKSVEPKALTSFLKRLKENGIKTISPSQIKDEEWAEKPKNITAGSWSPDKSLRIWTDSEDNKEYQRRSEEIYNKLSQLNWPVDIMKKIEPFLRIIENSDSRGWTPIPERKHEAYTAMNKVFEILEM